VASADKLSIVGLSTECVVGVYPRERGRPQPLRVDLDLYVDTEAAAKSGRLSRSVDYDATARLIEFLLQSCRFGLLETAAHAIATCLLAPPGPGERRAQIQAVRLKLIKPEALPKGALASLEIERDAAWAKLERVPVEFGTVDVLHESPEAGIYRLNLAPRRAVALEEHGRAHEAELVLTAGLCERGAPLPPGTRRSFQRGAPRELENPTRRWQSILCADSPLTPRRRSFTTARADHGM
jgi:dihydroneopterin aldolase